MCKGPHFTLIGPGAQDLRKRIARYKFLLCTGHFSTILDLASFESEVGVLETDLRVEKAMARYQTVYVSLYQRGPRVLRDLGNNWVLVNGVRMNVEELENLADQLQKEYQQVLVNKRNLVKKLLNWYSKP
jgi:hypothetical protein